MAFSSRSCCPDFVLVAVTSFSSPSSRSRCRRPTLTTITIPFSSPSSRSSRHRCLTLITVVSPSSCRISLSSPSSCRISLSSPSSCRHLVLVTVISLSLSFFSFLSVSFSPLSSCSRRWHLVLVVINISLLSFCRPCGSHHPRLTVPHLVALIIIVLSFFVTFILSFSPSCRRLCHHPVVFTAALSFSFCYVAACGPAGTALGSVFVASVKIVPMLFK